MTRVAIIGAGPTAAFVAKACIDFGAYTTLYAHGDIGKIPPGAFYFHWLPPELAKKHIPIQILVQGKGTAENYVKLQWGTNFVSTENSFPPQPRWEPAYNPSEVFSDLLSPKCVVQYIEFPFTDVNVEYLTTVYDLIFQTFPTQASKEKQPPLIPYYMGVRYGTEDENTPYISYNGTGRDIVVREASLFGNLFLEFPKNVGEEFIKSNMDVTGFRLVELKDMHPDTKPWISDNPKIKFMGRWAEWSTHRLTHEAYALTIAALQEINDVK